MLNVFSIIPAVKQLNMNVGGKCEIHYPNLFRHIFLRHIINCSPTKYFTNNINFLSSYKYIESLRTLSAAFQEILHNNTEIYAFCLCQYLKKGTCVHSRPTLFKDISLSYREPHNVMAFCTNEYTYWLRR
jgi:hypothetical protein